MSWLLNRFVEPSSWGGLGLITMGLGNLFRVNEAAPIAEAIGQGGAMVVQTGDPITGLIAAAVGLMSFFLQERTRDAGAQR